MKSAKEKNRLEDRKNVRGAIYIGLSGKVSMRRRRLSKTVKEGRDLSHAQPGVRSREQEFKQRELHMQRP